MAKVGRPTRVSKVLSNPILPKTLTTKVNERLMEDVGKFADQKKPLSPREWKFVQEYVAGCGEVTLKEAAIRAGYTENTAADVGNTLTNPKNSPHIDAAIQEYRTQLAAKYGTTYERHMRDMQTIRDAALNAGAYGAAVQAEYRRGQALGTIYVERKEIRHGTIDSMSREEVERKLAELKALYGGPPPTAIIDLPMEEVGKTIEVDPPFDPLKALEDVVETRAVTVQPLERELVGREDDPD